MACDGCCGGGNFQGGDGGFPMNGGMGAMNMGGMGYAGGPPGCCPPSMGYHGGPPMGYMGPPPMGYPGSPPVGFPGPQATSPTYQPNPFEPGSGCGGLSIACGPQDADIPPQAKVRKPRPPSSTVPKRKLGKSYTTLVTPLAGAKQISGEEPKDIPPDHERFDTLTLAFGTKPGTDKPPKILLTLKSPKVIDAKLGTGNAGTQVNYKDLGLPDPNVKLEDTKSRPGSRGSKKSKQSVKSGKSKNSKAKKSSKGKKGKK